VDDAVSHRHVGAGDLGVIHGDHIHVGYGQLDGGAVEGLDGAGDDIRARECSAEDMLGHQHGPAHHDQGHDCRCVRRCYGSGDAIVDREDWDGFSLCRLR